MEVLKDVAEYVAFLGQLFDKNGNVKNWWSSSSTLDFERKTKCLVNQYNNYQVFGEYVSKTKLHTCTTC